LLVVFKHDYSFNVVFQDPVLGVVKYLHPLNSGWAQEHLITG